MPRLPTNPYLRPINNVVHQMKAVPFPFPYVPQLVQLIVLTSVLLLFAGLFITIGLVSQIAGVFRGLILDAQKHLREESAVERSAQAVSIGIFSLLFVPFWLVQLPFSFIGSLWSSHRLGALATTAVLLSIIYALTLYSPYLIKFFAFVLVGQASCLWTTGILPVEKTRHAQKHARPSQVRERKFHC